MTVNEMIAKATKSIGENVKREVIVNWLWEIENTVVSEIAETHSGPAGNKEPITESTDGERILFVPDPYSRLYVDYVLMKWDDALGDTERYISSATRFSASYSSFSDWYNRMYMPYGESVSV